MLKDKWVDKKNGEDINSADDINQVAHAVVDLERKIEDVVLSAEVHVGAGAPVNGELLWVDTDEEDEEENEEAPAAATPDLAANEGEDGYIKNRTHYVDEKGVIHKLPNKFIDADWMATSEEGGGDYLIIPEQDVSGGMWSNRNMEIQPGLEYDVYINGVVYPCVAFNDDEGIVLGNNMALNKNNLPFCVVWAGGTATAGMFLHNNTLGSPIYLKVTDHKYTIYNKLPKGFLPDISWDELTDRPVVDGVGALLFSHTATFATDAAATAGVEVDVGAVSPDYNNVYWLEVNGELLKCHWERVDWVTSGLYDEDHNEWMRTVTAAVYVSAPKAGTYAYNLYKTSDELMLDPQYIPPNVAKKSDIPEGGGGADIDVTAQVGQTIIVKEVDENGKPTKWEAVEYQPRTHGEIIDQGEAVSYSGAVSSDDGNVLYHKTIWVYTGEEYTVSWNGVEYKCICQDVPADGYTMQGFGNIGAMTGGDDTGEPFVILVIPADMVEGVGYGAGIIPLDGSTEVFLTVTGKTKWFEQLGREYIDDALTASEEKLLSHVALHMLDTKTGMGIGTETTFINTIGWYSKANTLRPVIVGFDYNGVRHRVPVTFFQQNNLCCADTLVSLNGETGLFWLHISIDANNTAKGIITKLTE